VGVFKKELAVPAGQSVLRFATFDADTDGNDDVDLYLYSPSGVFTAISGGETSEEVVTVNNPAAGTWKLYVHGFQTDGPSADLTLFHWILGSGTANAGNMTVNGPFNATVGSVHTVNLTTSGLTAGDHYLGQIVYSGSTTPTLGTTLVRANP
jgi:hypothetical protein